MTNRKLIAAALIAAACSVAVAACGGSSDDTSSSTAAPAASSAATEGAATAAATTGGATSTDDNGGSQGDAAAGKPVFASNCGGCHTLKDAGTSGQVGPDLDQLQPDFETVKHQVENGGSVMPAFEGSLSDADIDNVAAYVSSVAGR